MVTPQGFNALLKIVEEPPEHVKFIFATTEPEKVIGTIRSRTHHYPFRLVPPALMLEYVEQLCATARASTVEPGVLPLVVRAGGGSVRDTLSLLDQLIAGSEGSQRRSTSAPSRCSATRTPRCSTRSSRPSARAMPPRRSRAVDRVIQTGQDPRRFVEDLLERLRDLIVVAATADGAAAVLRGIPQDELDRMAQQAALFGAAELSRGGGCRQRRAHRDDRRDVASTAARIAHRARAAPVQRRHRAGDAGSAGTPRASDRRGRGGAHRADTGGRAAGRVSPSGRQRTRAGRRPAGSRPAPAAEPTPANAPRPAQTQPVTLQQVKDAWPEILRVVEGAKRTAWMVLATAQPRELRDNSVLVLAFPSQKDVDGLKERSAPGTGIGDYLKQAMFEVLGIKPALLAKVDTRPARDAPPTPPPARLTTEQDAPDQDEPGLPRGRARRPRGARRWRARAGCRTGAGPRVVHRPGTRLCAGRGRSGRRIWRRDVTQSDRQADEEVCSRQHQHQPPLPP